MMNTTEIKIKLNRLAELLHCGGLTSWRDAIEQCCDEIENDTLGTVAKIIRMFGGMGSLNDLILYKDGKPMHMENNELDSLKPRLFSLLHE